MQFDRESFTLTPGRRPASVALIIGLLGLVLGVIGYVSDASQFFRSYLVAFVFWLSISLGGLFFTMLHNLVDAKWSVVLRRLSESIAAVLPLMVLFVIPVLFGIHELYHWSHADVVAGDEVLQGKAGYLNTPFFIIRTAGYFLIWIVFTLLLYRTSVKQDADGSRDVRLRLRKISAPGIILFALSSTFAAFDWLMSLDAHWYSSIYGVYVFTGGFLAALSFIILTLLSLRRHGVLSEHITVGHYHDLGKLVFAFVIFWAYMGFSQYFLIWYANIPEETVWYTHRWEGSWKILSLLIVIGHFFLPFFVLMTRAAKRSLPVLLAVSVWLLFMRWVDLYWLVFPGEHSHGVHISWMDPVAMIGIGGVYIWYFWRRFTSRPLVPVGDPGLQRSISIPGH